MNETNECCRVSTLLQEYFFHCVFHKILLERQSEQNQHFVMIFYSRPHFIKYLGYWSDVENVKPYSDVLVLPCANESCKTYFSQQLLN